MTYYIKSVDYYVDRGIAVIRQKLIEEAKGNKNLVNGILGVIKPVSKVSFRSFHCQLPLYMLQCNVRSSMLISMKEMLHLTLFIFRRKFIYFFLLFAFNEFCLFLLHFCFT